MSGGPFSGVLVPMVMPFGADLKPSTDRFIAHCRRLLDGGADGLAVFGTTSEANSMSADERMALLDALVAAGVPAAKLMPGTGACSITEAARLVSHALAHGVGGVLMLPPFYYKGMSDDGIADFLDAVLDRAGTDALRMYLYHIPPVAQVGFSHDLVERLVSRHPNTIVGLKDSGGDWSYTETLLKRIPGFGLFSGSEHFLLKNLRAGGPGVISATANVNIAGIRRLIEAFKAGGGDAEQARATEARKIIEGFPVVPALKALIAEATGDAGWAQVRPPFRKLPADKARELLAALRARGFDVGGQSVLSEAA